MTLAEGGGWRRERAPALRFLMVSALFLRIFLAMALSVGVTGCASLRPAGATLQGDLLAGRMTVRVAGTGGAPRQTVSAAFELSGTPENGRLDLSTPLGTTLARARWQPGSVALVTPQGETRYADLDSLTRELLGEPLPVAALFDWLHGRPWTGAASLPNDAASIPGFSQLGWSVNLARFGEAWVLASREQAPAVTVQVKLDRQ